MIEFQNFVVFLSGSYASWVALTIITFSGVLMYSRIRSLHLLWRIIWIKIFGVLEIKDACIRESIQDMDSLVGYKLTTGIAKLRTLGDAKRLIDWMHATNTSANEVGNCGILFDLEKPGPRNLPSRKFKLMVRGIICTMLCGLALVTAATASRGISYFRSRLSGNWYGLESETVYVPVGLLQPVHLFDSSQCQAPAHLATEVRRPVEDINLICTELKRFDWEKFLRQTLLKQTIMLLGMLFLSLFYFGCLAPH